MVHWAIFLSSVSSPLPSFKPHSKEKNPQSSALGLLEQPQCNQSIRLHEWQKPFLEWGWPMCCTWAVLWATWGCCPWRPHVKMMTTQAPLLTCSHVSVPNFVLSVFKLAERRLWIWKVYPRTEVVVVVFTYGFHTLALGSLGCCVGQWRNRYSDKNAKKYI